MPNENTTNVKFSRGQAANLPEVEDGQIIFTTDTGKLYVDNGTNRTLINEDIPNVPTASTTTPVEIATNAAIGTSTNYARADHKHKIALATGDNNGQVKIAGSNVTVKGLSDAAYKGVASSISSTETGLVTGQQVYNYIDSATSGITGAMHFAGVATSAVTDGGTEDPSIAGYSTKTAGDVVLYGDQEFVWTGVYWEELGNEGSHALKTVKISAGTGLSGGGTLAADRTLSLKTASSSEIGGIKIGYTTSGKNYKVNVDSNGNAYVNVPWTDNNDNTTYTFAEGSTDGAFSVTPSGGSAQSVKVHGLAAAAYKGIETNNSSDTSGLVTLDKVNTLIAGATGVDDSNFVHITGTETITGAKTFTNNVNVLKTNAQAASQVQSGAGRVLIYANGASTSDIGGLYVQNANNDTGATIITVAQNNTPTYRGGYSTGVIAQKSSVTRGTAPSTAVWKNISRVEDTNGDELMLIQQWNGTTGWNAARMFVYDYTADTTSGTSLALYSERNNGDAGYAELNKELRISYKAKGIQLKDSTDTYYGAIYDNGSNLYIGSTTASAHHHVGSTYISAGYNSTDSTGNATIYVGVPNAANNGQTAYKVYHEGYLPPNDKTTSSNSTSKLYLIGATSQSSSGVTTYSNSSVYATNGTVTATNFAGNWNGNADSAFVHIANAETITGAKTFSSTTVFSKNQDAAGNANNSPALIVGGTATTAHLELDTNEIIAKSDGTTPTALWLGDGSTVNVNSTSFNVYNKPTGGTEQTGFVTLMVDNEGGTILLNSKNGTYTYEIDAYNDNTIRLHNNRKRPSGVEYKSISWSGETGTLTAPLFSGPWSGGLYNGVAYQTSAVTKGTNPSSEVWKSLLGVFDQTGTTAAKALMRFQQWVNASGWNCGRMMVYDYKSGLETGTQLNLYGNQYDSNGNVTANGYAAINRSLEVAGTVTVKGGNGVGRFRTQNTATTKGTAPSATQEIYCWQALDSAGTETAVIKQQIVTNNSSHLYLFNRAWASGSTQTYLDLVNSATDHYVATASRLSVNNTTAATSKTTGALVVSGGAGFNGDVYATNFVGNWNGIAIGSGTTTYLRNDGTWATPAGDHKVTQTLYSENYNLPLLMSYKTNGNTTANVTETTFRNNSIYANPSTGTIYAKFYGEGFIYNRASATKGTAPSATVWYDANSGRVFQTGTGTAAADRISNIEGTVDTNKNNIVYIFAYDWTSGSANASHLAITGGGGTFGGRVSANVPIYGAVFNDYAEYREIKEDIEPGRCVIETGHGDLVLCNERLAPGAEIISDTYGFAIGQTEKYNTPIASSGRVLAYTYEDRDEFKPGDAVCSGPNGTISRMTREEIREWPDRIIGTVSEIPDYEIWQAGDIKENPTNVKVNGRIWIRIR